MHYTYTVHLRTVTTYASSTKICTDLESYVAMGFFFPHTPLEPVCILIKYTILLRRIHALTFDTAAARPAWHLSSCLSSGKLVNIRFATQRRIVRNNFAIFPSSCVILPIVTGYVYRYIYSCRRERNAYWFDKANTAQSIRNSCSTENTCPRDSSFLLNSHVPRTKNTEARKPAKKKSTLNIMFSYSA